jgi:hypothetical protein
MSHQLEIIQSLIAACDKIIDEVSEEELARSGLFFAWMKQVSSALLVANMEVERQVWDEARAVKVSLHERKALEAYITGMRAILLGMLSALEEASVDEP